MFHFAGGRASECLSKQQAQTRNSSSNERCTIHDAKTGMADDGDGFESLSATVILLLTCYFYRLSIEPPTSMKNPVHKMGHRRVEKKWKANYYLVMSVCIIACIQSKYEVYHPVVTVMISVNEPQWCIINGTSGECVTSAYRLEM